MKMTGLHQLFPRVLQYLKDPSTSVMDVTSPEIDGIAYTSIKFPLFKNTIYIVCFHLSQFNDIFKMH